LDQHCKFYKIIGTISEKAIYKHISKVEDLKLSMASFKIPKLGCNHLSPSTSSFTSCLQLCPGGLEGQQQLPRPEEKSLLT